MGRIAISQLTGEGNQIVAHVRHSGKLGQVVTNIRYKRVVSREYSSEWE
jgi:hypothetical protein